MSPAAPRRLFARPPLLRVRVTPKGFFLVETGETLPELLGHALALRPQRKLFQDGTIACQSDDAETGSEGRRCEDCLHPLCRPWIRLRLGDRQVHYLLDLAVTSAKNLLEVEDKAAAQGRRLIDVPLRLTVKDRGHYGEVRFEPRDGPSIVHAIPQGLPPTGPQPLPQSGHRGPGTPRGPGEVRENPTPSDRDC